ncbi:MAG: DUF418 domain-containing protein [Rhizobacter sp.]|nr:DUF418 domain-containing protein [Ferruginibacter sp.]
MDSNISSLNQVSAAQQNRINILDSLRGIAILAVFLLNIPFFALPSPASFDLTLNNEIGTINEKFWYFSMWFLDGSQRAILSMLLGAGIIIYVARLENKMQGSFPAEYFIRRQLWLLVFGLVNAFVFLWPGDILFQYAICGIIIFVFRRLPVKGLLVAAGICLIAMTARENVDLFRQHQRIWKGEVVAKLDSSKTKLTDLQKDDLAAMTAFKESSLPAMQKKEMEKNLKQIRGNYSQVYKSQSALGARLHFYTSYYIIWDTLVFMFIGMALFKTGILTGAAGTRAYWIFCIAGLGPGLLLSYFRIQPILTAKFNQFEYTKKIFAEFYEISRVLRSLGIFGLIMLLFKSGWFDWFFKLMQPVGRMAFTNYLAQSIICAFYFYGFGFGMYGHLQRYEIYYVVAGVWVLQIIWSHLWLNYYQYGPLEWAWRSLVYWKIIPLGKKSLQI